MTDLMPSERSKDPRRVLQDLLEHLSRHDKPLGFLFGAGASASVSVDTDKETGRARSLIPTVDALTEKCRNIVQEEDEVFSEAWRQITEQIEASGMRVNIENILSHVEMKLRAVGPSDSLIGLNKAELSELNKTIRSTIAKAVQPKEELIPDNSPHDRFAEWLVRLDRDHPVELFTTNYDLLLERSLENNRVPIFDGFVGSREPFFSPESISRRRFSPGAGWVRLWKIHGSVNWQIRDDSGGKRIVRGATTETGEMVFPSFHKYDKSRKQPYIAIMDHLQEFLDREDVLLVCVGYGFNDQHINEIIFDTLQTRPRAHVTALLYDSLESYSELMDWALRLPNIIALGPTEGIVGGRRSMWASSGSIQELQFDTSQSAVQVTSDDEKEIRLEVGDFDVFADFLGQAFPQVDDRGDT